MTPTQSSSSSSATPIEPQTPTERLLFLGVIMGVAAVITIGLGATWAVLTVNGNAADFPDELAIAFFSALSFLFGGGIAARV